jgi:hypothetical protein
MGRVYQDRPDFDRIELAALLGVNAVLSRVGAGNAFLSAWLRHR